jgi:hypothetical protein
MEAVEEAKRDLAHKVIFDFENRRKVNQLIINCSARDWDGSGLLGGIPRVLGQISALTLKGPL